MKKRQDIIQKFSTFLMLESNRKNTSLIWKTDLRLEHNIKTLIQLEPAAKSEYWAHYFLKISKTKNITNSSLLNEGNYVHTEADFLQISPSVNLDQARMHLSSYLQEASFWAAYRCYQKFSFLRHRYPLEELFQIANTNINQPEKLFKSFDLKHPKYNIEAYTKVALVRSIQNIIYAQDIEAKRTKFSDYGLLKDLNAKELKEALVSKGIPETKINEYCLVWQCFDEIYYYKHEKNKDSSQLSETQISEILILYKQLCNRLNLKVAAVSTEIIQLILITCIQAAREYRTKRFYPIDDYTNLRDKTPSLLDDLIEEEEWKEVKSIVKNLFFELAESEQIMFNLWCGLNLTQTEIANVLKFKYTGIQKQYQVARHLGKHASHLLKKFLHEWRKIYPEVQINDDKDLEKIKDGMNSCLQILNKQIFTDMLFKVIKEHKFDLSLSLGDLNDDLINKFQTEIESTMQLKEKSLSCVSRKIGMFVSEYLHNHDINYIK
ncbi:hypothetical protein [Calothrix sp. PCC 6303]|uniref:hypothetical protein n=1 Tax=Calothrix sp. PCC 6303 TaxID=1170562 RepID=UPI0002A013B0|nr:hypothetical protein [Calothrix sp. PCC 6303]AFZ02870.1 hypothetical protein Cal6303_3954 [Calothrix sp. PCC 6303]